MKKQYLMNIISPISMKQFYGDKEINYITPEIATRSMTETEIINYLEVENKKPKKTIFKLQDYFTLDMYNSLVEVEDFLNKEAI